MKFYTHLQRNMIQCSLQKLQGTAKQCYVHESQATCFHSPTQYRRVPRHVSRLPRNPTKWWASPLLLARVSRCYKFISGPRFVEQFRMKRQLTLTDFVSQSSDHATPAMYPNIHCLLRIFCTLPVTTAECERSVSEIRRLKSYMRSSRKTK